MQGNQVIPADQTSFPAVTAGGTAAPSASIAVLYELATRTSDRPDPNALTVLILNEKLYHANDPRELAVLTKLREQVMLQNSTHQEQAQRLREEAQQHRHKRLLGSAALGIGAIMVCASPVGTVVAISSAGGISSAAIGAALSPLMPIGAFVMGIGLDSVAPGFTRRYFGPLQRFLTREQKNRRSQEEKK